MKERMKAESPRRTYTDLAMRESGRKVNAVTTRIRIAPPYIESSFQLPMNVERGEVNMSNDKKVAPNIKRNPWKMKRIAIILLFSDAKGFRIYST